MTMNIASNQSEENDTTGPIKQNPFGETYFYNINRNSFEKTSAYTLYESELADSLFEKNSLKIIIGSDSGLLAKYLVSKGIAHGSRYIFIEPPTVLKQLENSQLIPHERPPEIIFTTLNDWEECAQSFKIADYFYISAVSSINSFCAQENALPEYAELSWLITEKLDQMHWEFSMSLGCEAFIKRQLENIADALLPASLLENTFSGQTAVIMAGGPSLDEILPWIKQNRQRIIIFAVSRIARQLLHHHIEPDFIFSVDPSDLSFDISKDMLKFSNKPIFIYANHTISNLVSQWPGTSLYLGDRLPWMSKLNQKNFHGAGPTVTNTAIASAHLFGFERILLTGVDLCFTREGFSHAQGSDEHKAGPRFNLTSLQVETNDGSQAPTSCDFKAAINTLAHQAQSIKKDCKLISLSKNSAKVANIDYIPPEQITLTSPKSDITKIINQKIKQQQKTANHTLPLILDELKSAAFQIKTIYRLAEKALSINHKMYNAQGIIENYKDKKKLDHIEKKLNREYRKFSKVLKHFSVRRFIKITRPFEDNDLTAEDAEELGKIYYQAYRDGASALLNIIEDSIERLISRIEENSSHPDFDLIFKQWKKDDCPGRGRVWLQHHKQPLPQEIKQTFYQLEKNFNQILENKETQHLARAKSHSNFTTLKQRAEILFKHEKLEELQDLKNTLNQHVEYAEKDDIDPYCALIEGYIAELQNRPDLAVTAYHKIIDNDATVLHENALLRITSLSIAADDIDHAYLALQCLSQLSLVYLPFYAEICRINGLIKESIDSYSSYIEQFPGDSIVQLKLAHLLIDNKLTDSAEIILEYLIENDDKMKGAALRLKEELHAKTN